MFYQLQIITRCSFACFYCACRDMLQQDMARETFVRIVDGRKLPRCFIKSSSDFTATQQFSAHLASGLPSNCCEGFPQLTSEKRSAPLLPEML